MGRGETAGQHVLYVAHELPTFSNFVTRHNQHMVEMGESKSKTFLAYYVTPLRNLISSFN